MKTEIIVGSLIGVLFLLVVFYIVPGITSEPYVETTLNETEELMFDESVITQCVLYGCPDSDIKTHKFLWFKW